jgi:pimeloyl-ACP methyl ester carboxylesterase
MRLIRLGFVAALALVALAAVAVRADELPRRGFLGAALGPTPDGHGAAVLRVLPGAAAEAAGVHEGDVVVEVNGAATSSPAEVIAAFKPLRAGQALTLTVVRGGERKTLRSTLKDVVESAPDFDVEYRSVDVDGARRRVIVTRPRGAGKHPAVLMVGGIGCYSIDNPFDANDPYKKLLYALTRGGFVTVRVDKTGMGDSGGPPCATADLDLETRGYVAAARAARGYDFVDPDRLFVVGHSIGGLVGPLVAAEVPVRGIVAAETVGADWYEYELENTRRQLLLSGADYEAVEATMSDKPKCARLLLLDKQSPDEITKADAGCAQFMNYPADYRYVQQIADLNLAKLWKQFGGAVLAIYGSSDFITSADEHRYLVATVNAAHPGKGTFVEIPGMDHYLTKRASQAESMRSATTPGSPPGEYNEAFTETILSWLKANAT